MGRDGAADLSCHVDRIALSSAACPGRRSSPGKVRMGFVARYIDAWHRASAGVDVAAVSAVVDVLRDARARDATVWTLGNGGGSALASHLAIGLTLNTRRAEGQ